MGAPLYNARILATGETVQVYKHAKGFYVDYSNLETEYQKNEVQVLSEQKC